jgi:hypothetical protein
MDRETQFYTDLEFPPQMYRPDDILSVLRMCLLASSMTLRTRFSVRQVVPIGPVLKGR